MYFPDEFYLGGKWSFRPFFGPGDAGFLQSLSSRNASLPLRLAPGSQSHRGRTAVSLFIGLLPPPGSLELPSASKLGSTMAKPILFSVDDDSDVFRAIERDLRSHYGAEYRVIGSDSPEGALTLLKQLKVRNDSVALLLADQRMPHMDGIAFLREGMQFSRTQSGPCSPPTPTPTPRSAPSIRPTSTIFS